MFAGRNYLCINGKYSIPYEEEAYTKRGIKYFNDLMKPSKTFEISLRNMRVGDLVRGTRVRLFYNSVRDCWSIKVKINGTWIVWRHERNLFFLTDVFWVQRENTKFIEGNWDGKVDLSSEWYPVLIDPKRPFMRKKDDEWKPLEHSMQAKFVNCKKVYCRF